MNVSMNVNKMYFFLKCIVSAFLMIAVLFCGHVFFAEAATLAQLGISPSDNGSVSVTGDGVSNRVVGKNYIYYDVSPNTSLILKALPHNGYRFSNYVIKDEKGNDVTDNYHLAKDDPTVEIKMPSSKIFVTADFIKGNALDSSEDSTISKDAGNTTTESTALNSTDDKNANNKNESSVGSNTKSVLGFNLNKLIDFFSNDEQEIIDTAGPHIAVSVKADKTTGGTYNETTMKYVGEKQIGVYKYPEKITYNLIIKNYGDTDLHYVKLTDVISEKLKNAVDVNSIKFNLQKGYYVTTEDGEQIFVSMDEDEVSEDTVSEYKITNSDENFNSDFSKDSGGDLTYEKGDLIKSLTFNTIKAHNTITLKLTMTAKEGIKRAIDLENKVNVTAYYKKSEDVVLKGNYSEDKDNLEKLAEDSDMQQDSDFIHVGKYAIYYPQMSVAINADRTTNSTTLVDGVVTSVKNAGTYHAGDTVKYNIVVKNEGNVALKSVTLTDVLSEELQAVLDKEEPNAFFEKTVSITGKDGTLSTKMVTVANNTTAVIDELGAGDTATLTFMVKINPDAKEAKQLSNKITGTAKWGSKEGNTIQYETIEYDQTKHVSEDFISVIGKPEVVLGVLANKTTGAVLNSSGRYEGTKIPGKYNSGDTVDFKINVKNTGGSTLHNLKISDTMSEEMKKAVKLENAAFVISDDGVLSTALGNSTKISLQSNTEAVIEKLVPDDSFELHFKAVVAEKAAMLFKVTNTVKVEAQYDDLTKGTAINLVPVPVNEELQTDSDQFNVPGNPSATIELRSVKGSTTGGVGTSVINTYKAGELIQYEIIIRNIGDCDLKEILVKNVLDNVYKTLLKENGCTFSQNTMVNGVTKISDNLVKINSIPVGGSVTLPFTVTLKDGVTNQFKLACKAIMSPSYSVDGTNLAKISTSYDEELINVIGDGSVSIGIVSSKTTGKTLNEKTGRYSTKNVKPGMYENGEEVDFQITLTNTGTADLYNLSVNDVLSEELKSVLEQDYGFKISETGEYVTKNGEKVTLGTAEVLLNENYKPKYTDDKIEENDNGVSHNTSVLLPEDSDLTTEDGNNSNTEEDTNTSDNNTETINKIDKKSTEKNDLDKTNNLFSKDVLVVNAAEVANNQTTSQEELLENVFSNGSNSGTVTDNGIINVDGPTGGNSFTEENTPVSIQIISNGTVNNVSEKEQSIVLSKLPANDSVQIHFTGKISSTATNVTEANNKVNLTAYTLSEKGTLEPIKTTADMSDEDKITVKNTNSLRIAKIADKTTGATLKEGRYDGNRKVAEYGPTSTVKYKITVTNLGTKEASNLLVTEDPSDTLKELSEYGKFVTKGSVKTTKGKTANVTVDGITAVIDKLSAGDSLNLEFDVKLKKDIENTTGINNTVSISGNYLVDGQEIPAIATDLMTDSDKISINKTVKPTGNSNENKKAKEEKSKKAAVKSDNKSDKVTENVKTGDTFIVYLALVTLATVSVFTKIRHYHSI